MFLLIKKYLKTGRVIVSILFLISNNFESFATTYYFSSSKGNDSFSFEQAQKQSTPWKSLEKLNTVIPYLKPGDSVLFRRGDIFVGSLSLAVSGSATHLISFGAYGNKSKPIPQINGRISLSNWTKYDKNIWVTDAVQLSTKVNYFTINGKAYPMGRFPNADETPDGYLHLESADSILSITDEDLDTTTNWTGAEMVMKPRRWLIDRDSIIKQDGHTIWYQSFSRYIPPKGFGYFIQNHIKTLDRTGEWYYDAALKKLYLYLADATPQQYNIQASRYNILLEIKNQSNIRISDIAFIGANESAISINNAEQVEVKNCTIKYAGMNGIYGSDITGLLVDNNIVEDVNNTGLYLMRNCKNTVIRNNFIKRCGIIDGSGPSGNGKTVGLSLGGDNNLIEYNRIDSIGYIGLYFSGNDVIVKNNVISNFTMNKDDGGGIYVISGKRQGRVFTNRSIISNIIFNGIGNGAGTPLTDFRSALGIYMDDGTTGVDILNNFVSNCAEIGIFLHDASFINVKNNLSYGSGIPFAMHQDLIWNGGSMHDNKIENNILISSMEKPLLESFRTQENNVVNFGKLDNNHFWYPTPSRENKKSLFKEVIGSSKELRYSISEWKTKYNYEVNSSFTEIDSALFDKKILIAYNDSKKIKTTNLGKTVYKDVTGKKYSGVISLQPYSWVYLIMSEKD